MMTREEIANVLQQISDCVNSGGCNKCPHNGAIDCIWAGGGLNEKAAAALMDSRTIEILSEFAIENRERLSRARAELAAQMEGDDNPPPDAADMINHPPHYTYGKRECIDEMLAMFGPQQVIAYCRCAAYKYRYRAGHKGDPAQDLAKADWYIDKAVELMHDV